MSAAAFAAACGSSAPPTQVSSGGDDASPYHPDGNQGSVDGTAHDTGTDGSDANDDAADAHVDTGTDAHVDSGFDAGPPLCNPGMSVAGDGGTLVISTPDPDVMGGISDDELVIAWTSLPSGSDPVIHWAERALKTDAFGTPQTLGAQFGVAAPDKVALKGDGLRLVFVGSSRTYIYEVGRAAYGTDFNIDKTTESFQGVNSSTEGSTVSPGLSPFASPALASTFKTMWSFIHGTAGFGVSKNVLGVWSYPEYPTTLSPPASDAFKLTPTGWSMDGRTLFYWDSAQAVERAAWRDPLSKDTFVSAVDLGTTQQFAGPNAACDALYFSQPGSGGDLDIYVSGLQ